MRFKRIRTVVALLLTASMLPIASVIVRSTGTATPEAAAANIATVNSDYEAYLKSHANTPAGSGVMELGAAQVVANGTGVTLGNELAWTKNDAWVEYAVDIPAEGLYRMEIGYAMAEGLNRDLKIGIQINGSYPFSDAKEIEIPRIFRDKTAVTQDNNGNEISPKQIVSTDWQSCYLRSTNGFYVDDYTFYFAQGLNTIRITSNGINFKQNFLRIAPPQVVPEYQAYLQQNPGQDTTGQMIKLQAETAFAKSDSGLYPMYDRNSASVEDSHGDLNNPAKIRINSIGGSNWKDAGQWISWKVTVPESGYYNLGTKFRQNYLDGFFTSRDIYIDGKIPFDGYKGVRFTYDSDWQVKTLANNDTGELYKVYLTEGEHEIKISCTTGDCANTLRRLNDCVAGVNDLYRQIIMITSSTPDTLTDYFLEERIPNLIENFEKYKKMLDDEMAVILEISGGRGAKTAALETLSKQLGTFAEEPEQITSYIASFKNNISALSSWLISIKEQALQLDYLYLKSPDVEDPSANASFFNGLAYSVLRFFASFDSSNEQIGSTGEGRSVKVWLNASAAVVAGQAGSGRDQAQVLKDLIDESFTPETGIQIDLELVQGTLIEATLAGQGPDVAIGVAEDQPMNFAIRGALTDLRSFDDFDDVTPRFYQSAIEPFEFNGGCYALPDTQMFNMFFYRTDIFNALGIEPPETWDDFYNILPIIQRNNLQMTIPDIFATLLFQNGGQFYNEDQTVALFDHQVAIDAMSMYAEFFSSYNFEFITDFYSRFRSGDLVASIQPYSLYNQLSVAAPEINGLWAMTSIPGTVQADGSIDKSQNSAVSATVMFEGAKDKDAAWEFMKWWSRDDIKAEFGTRIESIMGPSARYTPANIGTLPLLPWNDSEIESLSAAWEEVVGVPQIPGSYYTARALVNAFRSIAYNGERPRRAMTVQNRYINDEITRKREEFGLSVYESE